MKANRTWSLVKVVGPYLILLVVIGCVALLCVERGKCNADEGFYALASKLVLAGEVPYRDFAYTQTPLFPYLQGCAMVVVGFGVRAQRWLNVFWDACMLGLIAWQFRRSSLSPVIVCSVLGLWVLSLPLFYFCTIGKTYALTQLLLTVAALGFWLERPRLALVWVALFGVLAIGCRLTVAPAVAVLYVGVAIGALRRNVGWMAILLTPVLLGSVLLLPFFLVAPENAYYWVWDYHTRSLFRGRSLLTIVGEVGLMAPGLLALVAWAGRHACSSWGRMSRPAWFLLAGVAGVVVNIVVPATYAEYTVLFGALLLLGAGGVLAEAGAFAGGRRATLVLAGLLSVTVITSMRDVRESYSTSYPANVAKASDFVTKHTAADALVLTPMPEIAVQSGRRAYPKLVLGKFAVTVEMSEAMAAQLNVLHFTQLVTTVRTGEAGAVVLSVWEAWNFTRSYPSMRFFNPVTTAQFESALESRYYLAYANADFVVYLPKKASAP